MSGIQFIDGDFFSYEMIDEISSQWSTFFAPKTVVAIMLPTGPDFVFAFLGAMKAGSIPCALYPPLRLGQLQEWKDKLKSDLETLKPSIIITDARLKPLLQKTIHYNIVTIEELRKIETKEITHSKPKDDDIAFIQLSSGSTGKSKAVAIDHAALKTNIELICNSFNQYINKQDIRALSWLPLYHDMGLVGLLLGSISNKNMLYIMGPEKFLMDPLRWPQLISDLNINVTVAPNFAFGLVLKRFKLHPERVFNLSSLKIALCAAEPISPATIREFECNFFSHGLKQNVITPAYGLAEATLAVSFSPFGTGLKTIHIDRHLLETTGEIKMVHQGAEICSLGKALPMVQIQIRSKEGTILPESKLGEVYIKAPSTMRGFWPTLTLEKGQWIPTGDQGFLMQNELYLWGRLKDIVIINGRNIDPAVIEQSLQTIDGIRAGKIVFTSAPNDQGEEELYLFAEVENEKNHSIVDSIANKVLSHFGLRIKHIALLKRGMLPTTSSGKLRRRETVRRWLEHRMEPNWFEKIKLKGELLWLKINQ